MKAATWGLTVAPATEPAAAAAYAPMLTAVLVTSAEAVEVFWAETWRFPPSVSVLWSV
jgi:hypothetical protein